MGLFNNWQLLIIRLLCFLGWLSSFAFAQYDISEGVSGMLNFPTLGVTCLGNLSVFVTALIRGRLDAEIGARDAFDILASPKPKIINGVKYGNGLTTCTEEELTQTASTEGGLPTEEGTTQAASTGGLHTEEEATQTASTEGGLHTEEEATQTASTGGGCLHYFRLLQNVFGQFFHKEGGLLPASTERKGLKTASVVMLSYGKPNLSITDFMRYNDPFVEFILLHFLPLRDIRNDADVADAINNEKVREELTRENLPVADAINNANVRAEHTPEVILERCPEHSCNCIVFWTVKEITNMLARRMPGTLKQLSKSLCLLPCLTCLTKGCHGCNQEGLSPVKQSDEGYRSDEEYILRKRDSKVECEILDEVKAGSIRPGKPICICIPMNDALCDKWTELLVRSLRSKDAENRGVRVKASEAMESYLAGGRGGAKESVKYNILPYILPRLTEIFINVVLTICFRVDGFSSSLIARRTVRDYVVDSKGSGLAANAFLTKAVVKCGAKKTRVCQVLTFRENYLCIRYLSRVVGCVNLLSSIVWALLISFDGGADSFPPLSTARLDVIILFISIAGAMDETTLIMSSLRFDGSGGFFQVLPPILRRILILPVLHSRFMSLIRRGSRYPIFMRFIQRGSSDPIFMRRALSYPGLKMFVLVFIWVLYLELSYPIVISLALRSGRGEKDYGRWIYGALQALVWLKWAVGSYIINFEKSLEFTGKSPHTWGILVHSSAFMLNAVTAGVRLKWKLWPWKHHHLVPRKLGP